MRNSYLKAGIIVVILIFLINSVCALEQGNVILTHDSNISVSPEWIAPTISTNLMFNTTNLASSTNSITKIQFFNTNDTDMDPFNITNIYCPVGWTSSLSEGEPAGQEDGMMDRAECSNGILNVDTSVLINLTVISKAIPIGSVLSPAWTVITTDANPPANVRFFWPVVGIDAQGPTLNVITPTNDSLNSKNITINITTDESEVQINTSSFKFNFSCLIGDALTTPIEMINNTEKNNSYNISFIWDSSVNTTDGDCNITVAISDTLGNENSFIRSIILDNTAPNITLISPLNETIMKNGSLIEFNITDLNNVSQYWYSINNGATNTTFTALYNITVSNWSSGLNNLIVWANDTSNNLQQTLFTFTIDDVGPVISILSPGSGDKLYIGDAMTVTANISDIWAGINSSEKCNVTLEGLSLGTANYNNVSDTCSNAFTVPSSLGTGSKILKVTTKDILGNNNSASISITLAKRSSGGSGGGRYIVPENKTEINIPPTLTAPKIENLNPIPNDTLICVSGNYSDADSDAKTSEEWKWHIDNLTLSITSNKLNLELINPKTGSVVYCSQRVSDGKDFSIWMDSNKVVVKELEQEEVVTVQEESETVEGGVGNALTGAFISGIGSIGEGGIVEFIAVISIITAICTFLVLRLVRNRGLHIKLI